MFPLDVPVPVAVAVGRIAVQPELILAQVGGDIDIILFVELVADIQVDVVERGRAVFIGFGQQFQQPVGVGRPCTEDERGLVPDDRPFYVQPAG